MMKQVLDALRAHYDWVLIDTPPILAMADTAVLCPLVEGVVLVIGGREGDEAVRVRAPSTRCTSVGGKVIGVVLNKVNLERNSYYYSQYYGEYYRSYYAEKDSKSRATAEPETRLRPPRPHGARERRAGMTMGSRRLEPPMPRALCSGRSTTMRRAIAIGLAVLMALPAGGVRSALRRLG